MALLVLVLFIIGYCPLLLRYRSLNRVIRLEDGINFLEVAVRDTRTISSFSEYEERILPSFRFNESEIYDNHTHGIPDGVKEIEPANR